MNMYIKCVNTSSCQLKNSAERKTNTQKINTIDSRGFDQALIENRGTISAIINNALTERGRGELV